MSAIRRTLTLACPVILFAVASVQLARQILAHYPDTAVLCARIKFHYNALPWVSASAAWVLAMFLPVAVFALWVERLFSKKLLVLMSEGGHPLKIREVAINQYIHDDVMALPFVRQARVASRAVSGALALKVRVWVGRSTSVACAVKVITVSSSPDAVAGTSERIGAMFTSFT